jgi:hypothetical protein
MPLPMLAAFLAAAAIAYPLLPAHIPYHLNLDGTQKYADRGFVFLFAAIPSVLYVAIRAKCNKN